LNVTITQDGNEQQSPLDELELEEDDEEPELDPEQFVIG
jgi:hypothetical protein